MKETLMPAEIPHEIRPMLEAYLKAFHAQFPDLLQGFYIHGSIALGAFLPEWSDIDTVAVLKRPMNETEFETLSQLHRELIINYDKWLLEVTYLLAEDLGAESHLPRPNYHDGSLSMGIFEANDVSWWLLKHKAIVVYGEALDFPVDWDRLIAKMHANMNSYWRGFSTEPQKIAWVFSDYGVQWVVLGTLRQYYTFCENEITSKVGAGEYGLQVFPQWQRIIQEALNIRLNQPRSYKNRLRRAVDTIRFLRFIIHESNK
jgi:hypothetical protein